jgi:hypothetical protein
MSGIICDIDISQQLIKSGHDQQYHQYQQMYFLIECHWLDVLNITTTIHSGYSSDKHNHDHVMLKMHFLLLTL